MNRNFLVGLGVIIAVALLSTGLYLRFQKQLPQSQIAPSPLPSPAESFPSSQESQEGTPGQAPGRQPDTGSNTAQVQNLGINLQTPEAASLITSPVVVAGRANVESGQVVIRLKDANGQVLGESTVNACFGLDSCPFEGQISFSTPDSQTGIIEPSSTNDGQIQYLQNILVRFH